MKTLSKDDPLNVRVLARYLRDCPRQHGHPLPDNRKTTVHGDVVLVNNRAGVLACYEQRAGKLARVPVEEMKAACIRNLLRDRQFPCPFCGSTNSTGYVCSDNESFQCTCMDCGEPFWGEVAGFEINEIQIEGDDTKGVEK